MVSTLLHCQLKHKHTTNPVSFSELKMDALSPQFFCCCHNFWASTHGGSVILIVNETQSTRSDCRWEYHPSFQGWNWKLHRWMSVKQLSTSNIVSHFWDWLCNNQEALVGPVLVSASRCLLGGGDQALSTSAAWWFMKWDSVLEPIILHTLNSSFTSCQVHQCAWSTLLMFLIYTVHTGIWCLCVEILRWLFWPVMSKRDDE